MGTERHVSKRTPCGCGGGEFIFIDCEQDGWWGVGNDWYEMEITCPACIQKYAALDPNLKWNKRIKIEKRETPPQLP